MTDVHCQSSCVAVLQVPGIHGCGKVRATIAFDLRLPASFLSSATSLYEVEIMQSGCTEVVKKNRLQACCCWNKI